MTGQTTEPGLPDGAAGRDGDEARVGYNEPIAVRATKRLSSGPPAPRLGRRRDPGAEAEGSG